METEISGKVMNEWMKTLPDISFDVGLVSRARLSGSFCLLPEVQISEINFGVMIPSVKMNIGLSCTY